ncbi:hypothetical protein SETIT_5G155800v2 [Setaria italica]|uniref:Uncharacterized protein n=1 Tax=Setaria italica TaxID=4555 RepID=K3XP60_SETIT|nr:hypothetical protein SETIT_5G155800v2 [Setaria italica]
MDGPSDQHVPNGYRGCERPGVRKRMKSYELNRSFGLANTVLGGHSEMGDKEDIGSARH